MNYSMTGYLITIFANLLFACGSTTDPAEETLDFEFKTLTYQTPNCEPERDACLMVTMLYPKFTRGDSAAMAFANRIIRNSTLDFIGMGDVEAETTPEIETAVVDLDHSLQELKKEFGTASGWMAELHTTKIFRNDSILVLAVGTMGYFGGAHGNYNTRYFNFNRKTGRLFPLTDFVDLEEFTAKAEVVFKDNYLDDEQSYLDAGFTFPDGKYRLSANYAFSGDSIILHYNHYEIASYADGAFNIVVPIR